MLVHEAEILVRELSKGVNYFIAEAFSGEEVMRKTKLTEDEKIIENTIEISDKKK